MNLFRRVSDYLVDKNYRVTLSKKWVHIINYLEIVTDSYELIRPAFTAIAIYLPLVTFFGVIEFTYMKVGEAFPQYIKRSF